MEKEKIKSRSLKPSLQESDLKVSVTPSTPHKMERDILKAVSCGFK